MNAKNDTGARIGFATVLRYLAVAFAPEDGTGTGAADLYPNDPAKTDPAKVETDKTDKTDPAKVEVETDKAKEEAKTTADDKVDPKAEDKTKDAKVEDKKVDDAAKTNAPEKYVFAAPEGFTISDDMQARFDPVARDLDLTQEQAQKLVDLYAAVRKDDHQKHETIVADWVDQAKKDPEIGGDHWDTTCNDVKRALKAYASPPLIEYFELSGLGNHPELIRVFAKIGKSIKDDPVDVPNVDGRGGRPAAFSYRDMYPDDKPRA